MYCLRPQIPKVPEGDFVGPCCDPLGWAAKAAASETVGYVPNPPPADSAAAKRLADQANAGKHGVVNPGRGASADGSVVAGEQVPASSEPFGTDSHEVSRDELELVIDDAESETLDVLSVDAPLTHDACVKFVGLLIRQTAASIRKSDAMRKRRKEHQTAPPPNQHHDSALNDSMSSHSSTAASAAPCPVDAPQAMLAKQAVPQLLVVGLNLAWRDLDIELLKSALTLAQFANCMDLFFHHCNVREWPPARPLARPRW